jgi:hypothetical protein
MVARPTRTPIMTPPTAPGDNPCDSEPPAADEVLGPGLGLCVLLGAAVLYIQPVSVSMVVEQLTGLTQPPNDQRTGVYPLLDCSE